jgi:hypothetical protein
VKFKMSYFNTKIGKNPIMCNYFIILYILIFTPNISSQLLLQI